MQVTLTYSVEGCNTNVLVNGEYRFCVELEEETMNWKVISVLGETDFETKRRAFQFIEDSVRAEFLRRLDQVH